MRAAFAVIVTVCSATIALADDFKTIDGKEYKNVKVSRVEPDGIVITFSGGIVKIPFTELSPEIQKKYSYDPRAATAYSAGQNEQQAALARQRKADEQQRLDERQKYWSEHPAPQPAPVAPTATATPVRAAESRELASIRAEAEIREAETRGDHFDAEVARIKAYYDPRISAAAQAGDTKLVNELTELKKREFYQAVGRKTLGK
jgi:hypothetical protein